VLRAQLHSVSIVSTNLRPSTCPRRMPAARSATASTRTFTAKSAQDICLSCVYAYVCVRMRACEPTGPPLPHTPPWLPPASARCLAPARVSPSTVVALSTSLPLSLSLARSRSHSLAISLAISGSLSFALSRSLARSLARSPCLAHAKLLTH